jgi:hypothetical protein
MEDGKRFKEYRHDQDNLDFDVHKDKWKNTVIKSWNVVMEPKPDAYAKGLLMKQMDEYDEMFRMHFSQNDPLFMTGAASWQKELTVYITALRRHADVVAQQPETNKSVTHVREALPGRLRFTTTDHTDIRIGPIFPILTKSVIPVMVDSLNSIEKALQEVSVNIHPIVGTKATKML